MELSRTEINKEERKICKSYALLAGWLVSRVEGCLSLRFSGVLSVQNCKRLFSKPHRKYHSFLLKSKLNLGGNFMASFGHLVVVFSTKILSCSDFYNFCAEWHPFQCRIHPGSEKNTPDCAGLISVQDSSGKVRSTVPPNGAGIWHRLWRKAYFPYRKEIGKAGKEIKHHRI